MHCEGHDYGHVRLGGSGSVGRFPAPLDPRRAHLPRQMSPGNQSGEADLHPSQIEGRIDSSYFTKQGEGSMLKIHSFESARKTWVIAPNGSIDSSNVQELKSALDS